MPVSEGSLYNFNKQTYEKLAGFEAISEEHLVGSPCIYVDETVTIRLIIMQQSAILNHLLLDVKTGYLIKHHAVLMPAQ